MSFLNVFSNNNEKMNSGTHTERKKAKTLYKVIDKTFYKEDKNYYLKYNHFLKNLNYYSEQLMSLLVVFFLIS